MSTRALLTDEFRASNGIFFRVVGEGEPLMLLHGVMVTGEMFDPLLPFLQSEFCMLIPDLRGHGKSSKLRGPYDVPALAADLDVVMAESGFRSCAVLGYSHGGAVAQQLARMNPASVRRMILACTYACSVATFRERLQTSVLISLLTLLGPRKTANMVVQPWKLNRSGAVGLTTEQANRIRALMVTNRTGPTRGAIRGQANFDSRPWLKNIKVPTIVVGGTHDAAVPQYHFDTLVNGIPGARGRLIDRAGHTLIWTHTRDFAEIIRRQCRAPVV